MRTLKKRLLGSNASKWWHFVLFSLCKVSFAVHCLFSRGDRLISRESRAQSVNAARAPEHSLTLSFLLHTGAGRLSGVEKFLSGGTGIQRLRFQTEEQKRCPRQARVQGQAAGTFYTLMEGCAHDVSIGQYGGSGAHHMWAFQCLWIISQFKIQLFDKAKLKNV